MLSSLNIARFTCLSISVYSRGVSHPSKDQPQRRFTTDRTRSGVFSGVLPLALWSAKAIQAPHLACAYRITRHHSVCLIKVLDIHLKMLYCVYGTDRQTN